MHTIENGSPRLVWGQLNRLMHQKGVLVDVGEWQALSGVPQQRTIELEDVSFQTSTPTNLDRMVEEVQPNLPWAEDHFQERVSGKPLNPPPSSDWWPYAQNSHKQHVDDRKQFSHTYPERMWPVHANGGRATRFEGHRGIRYPYGDLGDLISLLNKRRGTRQAYLPIWFPEDLFAANVSGERVPCTLGYHFMVRQDRLKCVYYIRSCDLLRHFRDDVYMAMRLQVWIADLLDVGYGPFVMHISSLHIFETEREVARQNADEVSDAAEEAIYGMWW